MSGLYANTSLRIASVASCGVQSLGASAERSHPTMLKDTSVSFSRRLAVSDARTGLLKVEDVAEILGGSGGDGVERHWARLVVDAKRALSILSI